MVISVSISTSVPLAHDTRFREDGTVACMLWRWRPGRDGGEGG